MMQNKIILHEEYNFSLRRANSNSPNGGILEDDNKTSSMESKAIQPLDLAIMKMLPLFALFTLTQELTILKYLNRVVAFALLALVIVSLLRSGMERWKYAVLSLYIAVFIVSVGLTHWSAQVIAAAPRGLFCISLLLYFHAHFDDCQSFCVKYYKYLQVVVFLWTILVALSIPMASSWSVQWGGSRYFTSYVRTAFQLMPTAMLIMALNLILVRIDRRSVKALLFCIVPVFAGLQGGSRTYFILILLMALLVLMSCKLTKGQIVAIAIFAGMIVAWLFTSSGIASKMANVTSNEQMAYNGMGFLGTLTSGRSEFWQADLEAFFNLNPLQQLVGNGFSFSYETNLEAVGNSIYAHDDFINLLMESAYVVMFAYLVSIVATFSLFWRSRKVSRFSFVVVLLLWLINAAVNSFYPYTSSVIAFLFTIVALAIVPDSTNYAANRACSIERKQEGALWRRI